jgi:hypothetical protein
VRETLIAIAVVAALASGVGMVGTWRHGTADVDRALSRLPGAGIADYLEVGGEVFDAFLGVVRLMGGTQETPEARQARAERAAEQSARRLSRLESLDAELRNFHAERFSPEVDEVIAASCRDPGHDVAGCVARIRTGLLALREKRDEDRWIYEHFFGWSRVLWGIAVVVASIWLIQAWREGRRESRRGTA